MTMRRRRVGEGGFTLVELLMVLAIFVVLVGITVPISMTMTDEMRLNNAAHEVERELQTARLKAVSSNRALQVRINCPAAGQYRIVEVMHSAIDNTAGRCSETTYPFPSPKDNDLATPSQDGPMRQLQDRTTFTSTALTVFQFLPDGRTFLVAGSALQAIAPAGATVVVARGTRTATVNINGMGRIRRQ